MGHGSTIAESQGALAESAGGGGGPMRNGEMLT